MGMKFVHQCFTDLTVFSHRKAPGCVHMLLTIHGCNDIMYGKANAVSNHVVRHSIR